MSNFISRLSPYYDSNGLPWCLAQFKTGVKNGDFKRYFNYHNVDYLTCEGCFQNNEKTGLFRNRSYLRDNEKQILRERREEFYDNEGKLDWYILYKYKEGHIQRATTYKINTKEQRWEAFNRIIYHNNGKFGELNVHREIPRGKVCFSEDGCIDSIDISYS